MLGLGLVLASSVAAQGAGDARLAVDAVLDSFHDAAAKADADRYFGHFTADGIFLGSDATERWTVPEFREWSKKYFARESAWVFVPRKRFVLFNDAGDIAWFDEITRSEHMGDCRGTGVLRKVDGTWRVAHYSLTVLIPNDVMNRVATIVRAWERDPKAPAPVTTVYVVRHAEKSKDDPRDPSLSERGRHRAMALALLLSKAGIDAVYSTEYKRTKETVAPIAAAAKVTPTVVGARELKKQVRLLRTAHAGDSVVVAGHSNTVPMLLRALGVEARVTLGEGDYGDLFVVQFRAGDTPTLVRLAFGPQ